MYKRFGKQKIFEDFSYAFKETGGYLLFGPSGSGKTTLVNIIAGLEQMDAGEYYLNGEKIQSDVQRETLYLKVSYITQDTYLIDFLTVRENLELSCQNLEMIEYCIKEFKLQDVMDQLPNTLSGGERQRVAIIRALCSEAKVIIADEPTASLDEENKHMIFSLLKKLSEKLLVICVSHDSVSKTYFNQELNFHELNLYNKEKEYTYTIKATVPTTYRNLKLRSYGKKQKRMDETFSTRLLIFILCLCFLILSFILYPGEKIKEGLFQLYDLNYLKLEIPRDDQALLNKIQKEYSIQALVYDYREGANYKKILEKEQVMEEIVSYEDSLSYETLPLGGAFKYNTHIAYGTYFTKANQVMLGYEKAKEYDSDEEALIDSEIVIETPRGKETFKIAGIFKPFAKEQYPYFQYGYVKEELNNNVFFTDLYASVYRFDNTYSQVEMFTGKRSNYTAYFTSKKALLKFQEEFGNNDKKELHKLLIKPVENYYLDTLDMFESASTFFFPISAMSFILASFFYVFSKFIHMHRARNNFSVFHFYGLAWRSVYRSYCVYFTMQIWKCILSALVLAFVLGYSANALNDYFVFLPFTMFSMDITLFLLLSGGMFMFLSICICGMIYRFRKYKWFDNLKIGRDLL